MCVEALHIHYLSQDFELAAAIAFSNKPWNKWNFQKIDCSPEFHKNIENCQSPTTFLGARAAGWSTGLVSKSIETLRIEVGGHLFSNMLKIKVCLHFHKNKARLAMSAVRGIDGPVIKSYLAACHLHWGVMRPYCSIMIIQGYNWLQPIVSCSLGQWYYNCRNFHLMTVYKGWVLSLSQTRESIGTSTCFNFEKETNLCDLRSESSDRLLVL